MKDALIGQSDLLSNFLKERLPKWWLSSTFSSSQRVLSAICLKSNLINSKIFSGLSKIDLNISRVSGTLVYALISIWV